MVETETLLRRAQQGDTAALGEILAGAQQACYGFALRLTRDPSAARDICQEAFLRATRDIGAIRESAAFQSWLFQLVYGVHRDLIRSEHARKERERRSGAMPDERVEPSALERLVNKELAEHVHQAMNELKESYRMALHLHYEQGLTVDAAAVVLGVPRGTLATNVRRGLEELRERLGAQGFACATPVVALALQHAAPQQAPAALTAFVKGLAVGGAGKAAGGGAVVMGGGAKAAGLAGSSSLVLKVALAVVMMASVLGFWQASQPPQTRAVAPVPVPIQVADAPDVAPANPATSPFIMVVKTDQEVKENPMANMVGYSMARPSQSNQFMLPLSIDFAYDCTVDWGDGQTEVVRSPLSAELVKQLNQEVAAKDGRYTVEEVVAHLREVAQAPIVIDPQYVSRLRLKDKKAQKNDVNMFYKKNTIREILQSMRVFYKSTLAFNKRDSAVTISDDKGGRGDLFVTHTYAKAGTYTVKITENVPGGFPAIHFNDDGDCAKVLELAQWGDGAWSSMESAFYGCGNMSITAKDTATARTDTITNFRSAWASCHSLQSFPELNTAGGKDFTSAWVGCTGLTSFPVLNTAAGTNFSQAWSECRGLSSFPLLNTAAGTNFNAAWYGCTGLTSFPLLNTAAGTDFSQAWCSCTGLKSFPVLNTAAGTNFSQAWNYCSGLTSFPMLDTAAGTDFSYTWMGCSGLTSFPLLNTAAGKNFKNAWERCSGLTSFPQLNTAAGTDFSGAWSKCTGLTNFPLLNTAAGTDFNEAWSGCTGLKNFPLLNTAAGTNFSGAWLQCTGLTSFPALNTAAGTNFSGAWLQCTGLTSFPLLNTAAGTNFNEAWSGCIGLTTFPLLNFGNMKDGENLFLGVTLTSASYDNLLSHIAASNTIPKVKFNGGHSKAAGVNGIQAREKLANNLAWKIKDGDKPKPAPAIVPERPKPPEEF